MGTRSLLIFMWDFTQIWINVRARFCALAYGAVKSVLKELLDILPLYLLLARSGE